MRYRNILALGLLLAPQALWAWDEVTVAAFSERSGMHVMEIMPALDNCDRAQHTRNICAHYDAFVAEMALDALVADIGFPPPEAYAALKSQTERDCVAQAESQAADREQMPVLVSQCMQASFQGQRGRVINEGNLFPLHDPAPAGSGLLRGEACHCGDEGDDD